jgi:hypothetical protein
LGQGGKKDAGRTVAAPVHVMLNIRQMRPNYGAAAVIFWLLLGCAA